MGDEELRLEHYYLENRDRLLAFIGMRVEDDALAEDILQDSLLRALRTSGDLRDREKLVSWLYRIIRNAITDSYRRSAAKRRKLEALASEVGDEERRADEVASPCGCFQDVLPTMKPEYSEVLEAMELGDATTEEMTARLGITANNLRVRRHRARKQLREQLRRTCKACAAHGCLDCTCAHRGPSAAPSDRSVIGRR